MHAPGTFDEGALSRSIYTTRISDAPRNQMTYRQLYARSKPYIQRCNPGARVHDNFFGRAVRERIVDLVEGIYKEFSHGTLNWAR